MCFVLFGCIRYHLVAYETRCKTGRTSAKVRASKSRRNFSQRKHPIHHIGFKLTFWCISYYLGAFGTVWLPYEMRLKTGRTSAKHTRSVPLHPKLTFWCVSNYLGESGTVCLLFKTRCKTGRTSAKVRATKSRRNFLQRTHPNHPIRP